MRPKQAAISGNCILWLLHRLLHVLLLLWLQLLLLRLALRREDHWWQATWHRVHVLMGVPLRLVHDNTKGEHIPLNIGHVG